MFIHYCYSVYLYIRVLDYLYTNFVKVEICIQIHSCKNKCEKMNFPIFTCISLINNPFMPTVAFSQPDFYKRYNRK